MNKSKRSYGNLSLEKVFRILNSFSLEVPELSLQEFIGTTGMHKSTLHRFLITLEDHNYLERNWLTGKYRPGLKLFELGTIVFRSMDLRKAAYPVLEELSGRIGLTVHLVVRDGLEAMYVDKFSLPDAIVQYSQLGKRLPLNCTAVGKVLLAYLPGGQREDLIGRIPMEKKTKNSITDKADFCRQLGKVLSLGYAIDAEELEEGLMCVAMPVFGLEGKIIAAVSVSGTTSRVKAKLDQGENLIASLREATSVMSRQLGCIDGELPGN